MFGRSSMVIAATLVGAGVVAGSVGTTVAGGLGRPAPQHGPTATVQVPHVHNYKRFSRHWRPLPSEPTAPGSQPTTGTVTGSQLRTGAVTGSVPTGAAGQHKPAPPSEPTATPQTSPSQPAEPDEPTAPSSQISVVVAAGEPTSLGGTHGTAGGEPPVTKGAVVGGGHEVAFFGRVIGGPHRRLLPDFELVNYDGVFRFDGESISPLVVEGDPIPALKNQAVEGPCWIEPSGLIDMNAAGQVVIAADVVGSDVNAQRCTTKGRASGLFLLTGGSPEPIAIEGDPALSGYGPMQARINDGGSVLFSASAGMAETRRQALFLSSAGRVSKVIAQGDPSPMGGTFGPPGVDGAAIQIDNRNEIVFLAPVGQATGIFTPTGKIVASGDPAPGGGEFGAVGMGTAAMSMNADGLILYTAEVVRTGGNTQETFITTYQGGGATIKRVAVEGWPVTALSRSGEAVFQLRSGELRLYRIDSTGETEDRGRVPQPGSGESNLQSVIPLAVASDGAVLAQANVSGNATLLFIENGGPSLCSFPQDKSGPPERTALEEWQQVRPDFAAQLKGAWGDSSRQPDEKQALQDVYDEIYEDVVRDWKLKFAETMIDAMTAGIDGGLKTKAFKVGLAYAVGQKLEGKGLEKAAAEIGGQLVGETAKKLLGEKVDQVIETLAKPGVEELLEKLDQHRKKGDFEILTHPGNGFLGNKANPSFVGVVTRLKCGEYTATLSVRGTNGRQVVVSMHWLYRQNEIKAWLPDFDSPTVPQK